MLSSDLIHGYVRKYTFHPVFARVEAPELLELAGTLIQLFQEAAAQHYSRSRLAEEVTPLVDGAGPRQLAQGLRRVLEERCEFAAATQMDCPALRRQAFSAAAAILRSDAPMEDLAEYQRQIAAALPNNPLIQLQDLYCDLPDRECMTSFQDIQPRQLLERYNLALVQGALLGADSMEIQVESRDVSRMRRLFQYLRFFQLLAEVRQGKSMTDGAIQMHLKVDGPGSILEHSRKYGVQLATFFPAICTMESWLMRANILWRGKKVLLELDQRTGLKCPYHNFAAAMPQEFQAFRKFFLENHPQWQLEEETPFLQGPDNEIIIPDFTFKHQDGTRVMVELFSRWHGAGLIRRLEWLAKRPRQKVVVGVDRTLLKQEKIAAAVEKSPWFQKHGVLFRDFPSAARLCKVMEALR